MMFISFMIFSIAHMLLTNYLFWHLTVVYPDDVDLATSLRWKIRLSGANVFVFAWSIYFFFRHNNHCEPGSKYSACEVNQFQRNRQAEIIDDIACFLVYTWFAVCEYLVVLTNIFYHGTAKWDFKDYVFVAQSSQGHRKRIGEDDQYCNNKYVQL